MIKKLILTVGMSSSGKTSFTEQFIRNNNNWVDLNRDDMRFRLFCDGKRDWTKYKFTKPNEQRVTVSIDRIAKWAVETNRNIIVSDTNLNPKIRQKWKDFAEQYGYEYEEKPFVVTWDEARKRNIQREGGIAESILWDQYLRMNEYMGRKIYSGTPDKPKAVIIDVDGTIAEMNGRKPYEWDKVDTDKPRYDIIAMIHGLTDSMNLKPVFLSGRDSICSHKTYLWIKSYVFDGSEDFPLFMRSIKDHRPDYVVKEKLFWEHVAPEYDVVSAIDDRPQVLRLWRELGIKNIIDVGGDRHREF